MFSSSRRRGRPCPRRGRRRGSRRGRGSPTGRARGRDRRRGRGGSAARGRRRARRRRGWRRSRARRSGGCARRSRRARAGASSRSRSVRRSNARSLSAFSSKTGALQPCWRASTTSWSQYAPLTSRTTSGEARGVRARPGLHDVERLRRVAQVGLQDDPGARPVGELGLGEQLEDELDDRLARVVGLHVDVQVRAEVLGGAQQLAQARAGVALAALRRVRAQQRGEGGDLHREVGAGDGAHFVVLEHRPFGQRAVDGGERLERLRAARGVALGLGGGDGRLAEQVDRRGDPVAPEGGQRARWRPRRTRRR